MSLRDYGLPDPDPIGPPAWERAPANTPPCPNCGGHLCTVTVGVEMPQLRGGTGICSYFGCPACPYASPSMTRAVMVEGANEPPLTEMLEALLKPNEESGE